jgi:hypothetical protein
MWASHPWGEDNIIPSLEDRVCREESKTNQCNACWCGKYRNGKLIG